MPNRTKYYDVMCIRTDYFNMTFNTCREAAEWLKWQHVSRSVNAARVGLSGVLTGKKQYYRGMTVTAERNY